MPDRSTQVPQQPVAGALLQNISNALVALHKEQFGRGPTKAQSNFAGADTLVCILEDALLPAERTMVDQLHVRHILLRPNEILDEAATQQKARGIREQIMAGDDFATIAKSVSEDPGSAGEGGDLGWLSPGDTVPEFEQAVANLPLKELSEPIKSRMGWHLVEVLERRSHDTTDEVKRNQCGRQIRGVKAEEERELWLRRLRDQAFVQIKR